MDITTKDMLKIRGFLADFHGVEVTEDEAREAYRGAWNSPEDFALSTVDVPAEVFAFVDWTKMAEDMVESGDYFLAFDEEALTHHAFLVAD